MAKSNRRRKREQSRRQAQAAQKRAAAQRRQAVDELMRVVTERRDQILDPGTPPEKLASLLAEQYGGDPVPPWLADLMLEKGSPPERLTLVAEALRAADGPSPSLTALTFTAMAARANGDAATSRRLLDQALADADDPGTRLELIKHLRGAGRVADAIERFEVRLREAPDDDNAVEQYGVTMEQAYDHVHGEAPAGSCPCGRSQPGTDGSGAAESGPGGDELPGSGPGGSGPSGSEPGAPWEECCGSRERAALSRFGDRLGLTALQDAISGYLAESGYGSAIDEQVAESLSYIEDLDWDPAEQAAFGELMAEHALLTAGLSQPADDEIGQEDEAENDTAMATFAADPSVPAELAERARAWRDHSHYGLWRIDEPRPAPGLWCTDINSGVLRYAEFPAGLTDGMPRWAVWLGGLVPVDGLWRCTGRGVLLSPAEADAAAELVQAATVTLVNDLSGKPKKGASRRAAEPMRIGRADPHGVQVDLYDQEPPYTVQLLSGVTGGLLSRIVAEVHQYRSGPPELRNSDGDVMCLITAQIKVTDAAEAAGRLAARTDFERDADDPARLTWFGKRIPDTQRAAMLANVQAQLREQGYQDTDIEDSPGAQRWVRGTLEVSGGEIVAEVNSRERLSRLVGVLARIGANPVVADEKRVDPTQDLAWPAGPRAFPRGPAPAAEGSEKHWLDERVPALRGRTPRQAAQGKERPWLEALLRQWEYEADLLAVQGKSGVDTGWLRHELGMGSDLDG